LKEALKPALRTRPKSALDSELVPVADEVTYRESKDVDIFQLARLFERAGWHDRTRDLGRLARLVKGSTFVVSAWRGDSLVGFARAISDGVSNAYISTVAVLESEPQREILHELLHRLMKGHDDITFVLQAVPAFASFYRSEGFEPASEMYRRPRKA
jgi:predicted GNAT family N-acyltransferase